MKRTRYSVIVIGGGHAGVEAAWAAANLLASSLADPIGSVALVTMDPNTIGVMSCNPANGGLAKGQLVREIDAMGGVMGLATDAVGIQFKMLNTSKGPAVWGPRAQCDKHAYAEIVRAMLATRPEIDIIAGTVDDLCVREGRIAGVVVSPACARNASSPRHGAGARPGGSDGLPSSPFSGATGPDAIAIESATELLADAVVLTTGTFMRAMMHTGEARLPGGRHGEGTAVGIAGVLKRLGFELGRLKTGTPPRLDRHSIDWDALPAQAGDERPTPFSDLSASPDGGVDAAAGRVPVGMSDREPEDSAQARNVFGAGDSDALPSLAAFPSLARFPVLPQTECRVTSTCAAVHDVIRANLHRAPMFSGQIEGVGPRYCPSIEDKVVRFAQRDSHTVFLEPESLRDDWIYCNGISTSLPADVQEQMVRAMPGCASARILRMGYAVEYDMVRPHQISATGMTKSVPGLFLAGQINGTSGYEEAAAQGVVAGINAARTSLGAPAWLPDRAESYIGVLMDDLVTKTPVEPYRMFTSRAEHRLLLRADNAADRLTPIARDLGLLSGHGLGRRRAACFEKRRAALARINGAMGPIRVDGEPLARRVLRPEFTPTDLARALAPGQFDPRELLTVVAERQYAGFIDRQRAEIKRQAALEHRRIPAVQDYTAIVGLRAEARSALSKFRPETFGQAARLEGITPADLTILAVHAKRVAAT